MKKVIPSLLNTDQNGYIKNLYSRKILDIIDYSEHFKNDACILFLDFKKDFETIEWDFMLMPILKIWILVNHALNGSKHYIVILKSVSKIIIGLLNVM